MWKQRSYHFSLSKSCCGSAEMGWTAFCILHASWAGEGEGGRGDVCRNSLVSISPAAVLAGLVGYRLLRYLRGSHHLQEQHGECGARTTRLSCLLKSVECIKMT